MADTAVSIVGNLTDDPELRFTSNGVPVASMSVAVNARIRKGDEWVDGPASFYRVTVWRGMAENVAEALQKGNRVLVIGTLKENRWEDNEGNNRSRIEIVADEVGPSLKWAIAEPKRNASNSKPKAEAGNGQQRRGKQASSRSRSTSRTRETVPTTGGEFDEEPPF